MKKSLACLLLVILLATSIPVCAEGMSQNAQTIYEAIRWNLNLPKDTFVVHAEEYLAKISDDVTLHTLVAELTVPQHFEMIYGFAGKLLMIDLDSGEVIDGTTFDGNVMWPEGDITSKYDAQHLLFSCYWSYVEGSNENIMHNHEIITPISEEEIATINAALTADFIR